MITDIQPMPEALLRRAPYISASGQVICPRCGNGHMVRQSVKAGALKAQWRCGAGHYSMLPADLVVRWIVVVAVDN